MASKFAAEVTAIKSIRNKYKSRPAKSLADQIAAVNFALPEDRDLAREAIGSISGARPGDTTRSVLSIYSVIRRHDSAVIEAAVVDAVNPHVAGRSAFSNFRS